jgi:hypothetical protein
MADDQRDKHSASLLDVHRVSAFHVGYSMSLAMARGAQRLIDELAQRQRDGLGDAQPSAALAIVGSVAYLEAYVNEYLDQLSRSISGAIRPGTKGPEGYSPLWGELALTMWWNADAERSTNPLGKYKRVLKALSPDEFDFTGELWVAATDLVDMRNELVHAKPHWRGEGLPPHKLEDRLLRHFDQRDLRASLGWPGGYVDLAGARWALQVAQRLTTATRELILAAGGTVAPRS